jgi:hypothetical protein
MPYNSKQDAVDALRPGYKVVGEAPYVVKVANPKAGLAGEPAQIDQQAGIILSIQGAGGEPDTMVVKEVGNNPNTKGGVGFDVITGPQSKPMPTSTPASGLERLDKDLNPIPAGSDEPTVYVRDPKAAPGTPPFKVDPTIKTDPSTWTPIKDPNNPDQVIGLWDPANNKIGATISSSSTKKPSGQFTNVIDPNDPAGKRVIGLVDTGDQSLHAVSQAPDGTQIVQTPTGIYSIDKDKGTSSLIQKLDPADPNKQAVTVGGKVYSFDPKDGSFTLPTNVQSAATVGNSTTLKELVWYDDQGNEVARRPNPNYQPPAAQVPTVNQNSRLIPIADPDHPGELKWVANEGRIVASDALKQLATNLTGQVVSGDMSQDEAIALINAANSRMTNDINAQQGVTTAAGDILANARGNATTGAGLLQQRVQAATGTLQSILGNALSNKNITSVPGDVGANLVQGLQGWTADLMGGQQTLDSAARMVQMADPKSDLADPTTQAAVGTLKQMLDQYHAMTGAPHPIVQATQAAQASQQQGGVVAPQTAVAAVPAIQAPGGVSSQNQVPGQNYGAATAYTAGVPPWQMGWTAPGANYSYTGAVPWAGAIPQPLPAFQAPVTS